MARNESSSNVSSSISHTSPSLTCSSILGAFVPCAACKILRRKCTQTCLLAPHFPPGDTLNFAAVHKVFGAGNVIKILQDVPDRHRDDATKSLVYEAKARLRDPVYGSAGIVFQLQRRVVDLQAQVAMAEAEFLTLRAQHANLLALICTKTAAPVAPPPHESCVNDDAPLWEHLLWA